MMEPVSLPISEILKKFGFDMKTFQWFFNSNLSDIKEGFYFNHSIRGVNYISAPTIDEVKWWLYDKHGIWIEVIHRTLWGFSIKNIKENVFELERLEFNSPTEAYQSAIEYVLKNLILNKYILDDGKH